MIKDVDRKYWITISKIAMPLKACTVMAAEIIGVSVLTEVLDLLFDKKLKTSLSASIKNWKITEPNDQRIDRT